MTEETKQLVAAYSGAIEALTAIAIATEDFKNLKTLLLIDTDRVRKPLVDFCNALETIDAVEPVKKPRKPRTKKAAKKEDAAPAEANEKEDEDF